MNIDELILALQQYPGNTKVAVLTSSAPPAVSNYTSYPIYYTEITSLKLVPAKPALQLYGSFFGYPPTTNNKILLITAG
jgi:hypothetical protein